ncbi:hypothetical protein RT99_00955 [Flavobacterium sp. MEB061]|uniref:hypothetical protein n=1 Tax=Flavobacterium sp. MEB061 TaxID=1587524 RepID=UPI0005AC6B0D|nr:hypothetical protein [Flavobacterium sp. MEB061]KIQ25512.1 hypothetical protein RT99_00955 [Flavobacterium sp. MEB061]
MVTTRTSQNTKIILLLFFYFLTFIGNAQVGIGTTNPNTSSVLDISSTTHGMLAPRMTTAQRNAIVTPADALLVYDTDVKSFYYYNATTAAWTILSGGTPSRANFKRIKAGDNLAVVLAPELAAGGGAKYVLTANTLYEINGQVVFNLPIDLNNAYLDGLDANEDIIVKTSGVLFDGTTGGSIRNLTITTPGATVFNLNAAASTSTFLLRDTVIANSNNIGLISGYGLVFLSIVNFSGNTNGITYNNIGQLLLSNQAWFSNNGGTYEKFTGTFNLIEKQGGFSNVASGAFGLDVSTPGLTISGDAVLESVVFTGPTPANYVRPYPASSTTYTGYNFNNSWTVRAAGIPTEADANAVGDFAIDYAVNNVGINVPLNNSTPSNIVKVGISSGTAPTTIYSNLFRFTTDATSAGYNRLVYAGKKKRIFQITGTISIQVPGAGIFLAYVTKNGTPLTQYKNYGRSTISGDIINLSLQATAELNTGDYIEVAVQRNSGATGTVSVPTLAITVK